MNLQFNQTAILKALGVFDLTHDPLAVATQKGEGITDADAQFISHHTNTAGLDADAVTNNVLETHHGVAFERTRITPFDKLALARQNPDLGIAPVGTVINVYFSAYGTPQTVTLPDHTQFVQVMAQGGSVSEFATLNFEGNPIVGSLANTANGGGSLIVSTGTSSPWYYTGNKRALTVQANTFGSGSAMLVAINCVIQA